jgi:hypothetical protein
MYKNDEFQLSELLRKKNIVKFIVFLYLGFHCVAINIKGSLKICIFHVWFIIDVIWLKIPTYDCHFFLHLPIND